MIENFQRYGKTSWFDSVSATTAVINQHRKSFIVQSKGPEHHGQALNFYGATLGFSMQRRLKNHFSLIGSF